MATQYTGWGCTHSTEVIAENNTSITIRVHCYWQNSGWRYNISNVYAYVYCGNQSATVLNNGAVNSSNIANTAALWIGSADFSFSKTHAAQSISCYATIDSNSSYAGNYTRSSSASTVSVAARPTHTITYNANGGTGAPASQTKWYSEAITLSSTKPTRTGYTFQHWNTNTSNTGTTYAPGATYNSNANLTLYAIWKANTYTVSYNANGGSNPPANQTKTHDVNLTLSSTKPTRTDYEFLGWSTSSTATTATYAAGGTFTTNANTTLFAVWKLAYKKPRITNFTAYRCDSTGASSETGTYIKVSFGWATDKTVTSVKAQHKLQSSSTWTNTPITASSTSGTPSIVIGGGGISTENSYHVRVYVSDSGGETYSTTLSIGTVKFPIDVKSGGTGVAIGKVAETENLFDVGWSAQFRGAIKATVSETIGTNLMFNANLDAVDLNNITSYGTGFYRCRYGCTNAPYNSGVENTHFYVLQNVWGVGTYAFQLASMVHGDVRLYHRTLVNGSWTQWRSLHEGPTGLFDSSSGTKGGITLNETAANFAYLEVYYGTSDTTYVVCEKVFVPNGKNIRLRWQGSTYLYHKDMTISGTSMTVKQHYRMSIADGSIDTSDAGANTLLIRKVIGYR